MRPELAAHAAQQNGLVTRRQAIEVGYTERELRTLTAVGGRWVTVRRGVYVERELWDALDPYDGQMATRDRAAHLMMVSVHVMSHDSAARAHGLPLLRPRLPLVHVTRPSVGGCRTEHGVKHHLAKVLPGPIEQASGLPVTGLARTCLDLGREHGLEQGVVACDAALRRGVTDGDFAEALVLMQNWAGVTVARASVEYADIGGETPGETLTRLLLIELGLGQVETQFPVKVTGGVAWCDLRVGCHIVEFDGRQKYRRIEDGGFAKKDPGDVVWDERKRQQEVCSRGLGMSRVIWADLWGAAREATKARIRAEYAVTLRSYGSVLPEQLEAFAQTMRGRRRTA